MATIIIGSARRDERLKYSGGKAGDQDRIEVSTQEFYKHSKGWYILRPITPSSAEKLAAAMLTACKNDNIGYSQSDRLGVVTAGIRTNKPVNADCSSLVRACIKDAMGIDVGNFNTENEKTVILKSKQFTFEGEFISQQITPIFNGDVLVTKKKGHTVIVVNGNPRANAPKYYPAYTGASSSIIDALKGVGEKDTTLAHRKQIGVANGVAGVGTLNGNNQMLHLLRAGKLKKA